MTFLVVACTGAQAASPAAASDASRLAGDQLLMPKLELNVTAIDYRIEDHNPASAGSLSDRRPATPVAGALSRLLPQSINDRTVGYRLWF